MLLHHSRSAARIDPDGNLATLENQDRALWNRELINQGTLSLDEALVGRSPGAYQLQAAISALHATADGYESTDWQQIYLLYTKLNQILPGPVVRLNAIVALSFAGGPEAALEALTDIRSAPELNDYLPLYATEADLLRRANRQAEAATAYRKAIELARNLPEREFLESRLSDID